MKIALHTPVPHPVYVCHGCEPHESGKAHIHFAAEKLRWGFSLNSFGRLEAGWYCKDCLEAPPAAQGPTLAEHVEAVTNAKWGEGHDDVVRQIRKAVVSMIDEFIPEGE